ncbi:hypothetical protein, partial [Clostridium celatum]|uniref:hypothetical protein n=1 Tax=Clostridium celatum TaxID=36834 RepID=UPI001899B6F6
MSKDVQLKVTKYGRIMRMLDMFEVIDLAEKEWEKPYQRGEFEYGKCVVVFADRECSCITYVPHHIMPMPYHIKDLEPNQFDKAYRTLERIFKEQGMTVIKSKKRVYVDA